MKTIGAAEFKERCLGTLDHPDAEGLIITKRRKPVARVLPFECPHAHLIGSLRHKVTVKGDLMSTGAPWNAGPQP